MAFRPVQLYQLPVTGTPSTAQLISEFDNSLLTTPEIQAEFYAQGCNVVYKVGDASNTAASRTVTSNKFVSSNTLVPQGAILLHGDIRKYISVVSLDGTSTGTLYMLVGYNEKI